MSERALRDEIEAIHAAILQERATLAVPIDAELSQARTALQAEVEALNRQLTELIARCEAREELTRVRTREEKDARSELDEARSKISALQPLGNPLQESRSNWEDPNAPGCGVGVLVLLSSAAFAATWWLS